jgi:hypothetical protein
VPLGWCKEGGRLLKNEIEILVDIYSINSALIMIKDKEPSWLVIIREIYDHADYANQAILRANRGWQ